MTLLSLIGALYFMVSGGPYGLEELAQKTGFSGAILILLATPIVWSLPTALMVGELAAAIPAEGGYYVWVRRALGPFWAYQEAWLSMAASVFDMAIYPTLFVQYLVRLVPGLGGSPYPILISVAVIAVCAIWNIAGARAVGDGSALMTALLLAPFVVLSLLAISHAASGAVAVPHRPPAREVSSRDIMGGVLIAMWNFMGWDNASTFAGEVERPQRTYPRAVLVAIALIVVTYVIPLGAMWASGADPSSWQTGSWVDAARDFGGAGLATAVVLGGMVSALGMFNALCLSYSRIPVVLAQDGYLPSACMRRIGKSEAPWVAILLCSTLWMASLGLSFQRLVSLDILFYGSSLILEFVAFFRLRKREPDLQRPFEVPGGLLGAALLGAGPLLLLGVALADNAGEKVGAVNAVLFGALIMAAGPILYVVTGLVRARTRKDSRERAVEG